jgi:hypothetical protein
VKPMIERDEDWSRDATVYRLVIPNGWFVEKKSKLTVKLLLTWWLVRTIWATKLPKKARRH